MEKDTASSLEKKQFLTSSIGKSKNPDVKFNQQKKDLLFSYGPVSVVLSVGNVALLVMLATLMGMWEVEMIPCPPEPRTDRPFCVMCDDIALSPDEDFVNFAELAVTDRDGVKTCCTKSSQQIPMVLELFVERKFRIDKANHTNDLRCYEIPDIRQSKPVAHLVGVHTADMDYKGLADDSMMQIKWNTASQASTVSENVTYSNEHHELTVQISGHYYVYSQIIFGADKEHTNSTSESKDTVLHYLYKTRNRQTQGTIEDLLAKNVQTRCRSKYTSSATYTSYIGGVYRLQAGDSVLARVSGRNTVHDSPHGNYFGLYMI